MSIPIDAQFIRSKLFSLGWTQAELAEASGLTQRGIEQILQRGRASLESIHRIAQALESDVEAIAMKPARETGLSPSAIRSIGPPSQLPAAPPDFVGRETEVRELASRLLGEGRFAGSVALRGMGGIGKTSLALRVGMEVRSHFPDGQIYLDFRGSSAERDRLRMTAAEAMAAIIRSLCPWLERIPDDPGTLAGQYRTALAGKRLLVVFDNVQDDDQVRSLLAVPPPVSFLLAGRNALTLDGLTTISVDVLSPAEAANLLRGIVGHAGTDEELDAIARIVGYLPLAVRVAGSFLQSHDDWTPERYLAALEAGGLDRLGRKVDEREVETVLKFSAVETANESPELAIRWESLAVFPGPFDAGAAAAVWDVAEDGARDDLSRLLDRSLIVFDRKTDRYGLHDLLRPIARECFAYAGLHSLAAESNDRTARSELRFARHYCEILAIANRTYREGNEAVLRGLSLFDREQANIRHGRRWAAEHWEIHPDAAQVCGDYGIVGPNIVSLRLTAREQLEWLEPAVRIFSKLGDRRSEGIAAGNLGNAQADLGNTIEAIRLYERRLEIARELGDLKGEGSALGSLGNAYAESGDARAAIPYYLKRLVIAEQLGDRPGLANGYGNLGSAYADIGDADRAIENYERQLAIAQELGDLRSVGAALGNLGAVHVELDETTKAIELFNRRIAIAQEIGDLNGEAGALANLGSCHANLGEFETAAKYFERRLEFAIESGDRRGEANTLHQLAACLIPLRNLDSAAQLARQALSIFESLQRTHPEPSAPAADGSNGTSWNQGMGERVRQCRLLLTRIGGEVVSGDPEGPDTREA